MELRGGSLELCAPEAEDLGEAAEAGGHRVRFEQHLLLRGREGEGVGERIDQGRVVHAGEEPGAEGVGSLGGGSSIGSSGFGSGSVQYSSAQACGTGLGHFIESGLPGRCRGQSSIANKKAMSAVIRSPPGWSSM